MSVVRATRRLVVVTDGDDEDLDGELGHEDVGHEDVDGELDEDLDGSLHEDRRESVDILADDLRSAIDGAKTCSNSLGQNIATVATFYLPSSWFRWLWHCFPLGGSPTALGSLQNDRRERVGISANAARWSQSRAGNFPP